LAKTAVTLWQQISMTNTWVRWINSSKCFYLWLHRRLLYKCTTDFLSSIYYSLFISPIVLVEKVKHSIPSCIAQCTGFGVEISMPISAGPTSRAHFASTPADGSHYDLASDDTVEYGGQSDHTIRHFNLQYDSNRPVRHLSLAPNSLILNKPRLPSLIHARLPVSQQWTSAKHHLSRPACGRCTDGLTTSK
jgi:hypothetical protein